MYAFAGVSAKYDNAVFPAPADEFVNQLGIFNLEILGYVPPKCLFRDATFYTTLVIKTIGLDVAGMSLESQQLTLLGL